MLLTLTSASAGEIFTYIGYILLALVALMFMIVVHESGHYLAGKMLGFTIDEFGIGFGPPIIKKRNKKTGELFTVRILPLGGFCASAKTTSTSSTHAAAKRRRLSPRSRRAGQGRTGRKKRLTPPKRGRSASRSTVRNPGNGSS